MSVAEGAGHVALRSRELARSIALAVLAFVLAAGLEMLHGDEAPRFDDETQGTALPDLPANVWVELETRNAALLPAFRTDHGGAVYDPLRNRLFLFGSDTHLRNFDNGLLELDLDDLTWRRPRERTPRFTLRTDAAGWRVAGGAGDVPWPMHGYDSVVYDRKLDRIVVVTGAKHSFVPAPGAQLDPIWAYAPETRDWSRLPLSGGRPIAFAAGAVYDSTRDVIMAYAALAEDTPFVPLAGEDDAVRTGVWELGPDRDRWLLASDELHHWGWFNAEFDSAHGVMLVFGGRARDSSVWAYEPAASPGAPGRWERRRPSGDPCPGGHYFPAAYDSKRQVTFFMPYDAERRRTVTCFYDYSANTTRRLPGAELPDVGQNYTLVYAEREDVLLLATGSFARNVPTRVWVLRPALGALE